MALCAVFLHESGHLLALRFMGKGIKEIRFELFGASIVPESLTDRQELFCALAGPAANFLSLVLLGIFWKEAAWIHVGMLIFNLLPIYPLDGGRILCCFLRKRISFPGLQKTVHLVGVSVSLAVMLLAASFFARISGGIPPMLLTGLMLLRLGKASEEEGF